MITTLGYGRRLASLMKRSTTCSGLPAPRWIPWWALADGSLVRLSDFPRPPLRAAAPPQPERGEVCPSLDPPQVCWLAPLLMSPLAATANVAGLLRPPRRKPRITVWHPWGRPPTTPSTCSTFALVVGTLAGGSAPNDVAAPAPPPFVLTGAAVRVAPCQPARLLSAACALPGLQHNRVGLTDLSMNAA